MGRVCAALIAAAAVLIAPPGAAWGAWTTSVSMYSDPGDFIGDGEQRVWHPGNSTEIRGIADGDGVNAWADFGPEQYSFMFAPPRGQALEPRNYLLAQRLAFRADGHPGLDVEGMSRACNELDGRFELLDVAIAPDGSVERLWAIYEQHCEFATAA
ncbi:MAG TPA: hypothetical protein VHF89_11505, partial [Solirubrobacteraceae bacterium]|nr:hypothetical protein [Solirubrobacteraceae bacterium]